MNKCEVAKCSENPGMLPLSGCQFTSLIHIKYRPYRFQRQLSIDCATDYLGSRLSWNAYVVWFVNNDGVDNIPADH